MSEEEIRELLELASWDEYQGFTTVGVLRCPHCEDEKVNAVGAMRGRVVCAKCGEMFAVTTSRSWSGIRYHTFKRVDRLFREGGDA